MKMLDGVITVLGGGLCLYVLFFLMDTYMCIALCCIWCLLFTLVYGCGRCHPRHMQQCISWREQCWWSSPSLIIQPSCLRFVVRLLLSIWLISCTLHPARVVNILVSFVRSSRRNCFCSTDDWCWRSDWWKPSCPWLFACAGEGKHLLLVILLA